jgi:uncharacterized protein Yka (UPF0111/DUF47 family)
MKTLLTLAILLGSTTAFSQEEPRRDFEKAMKTLQEKFEAERAKLEREFKERLAKPDDLLARLRERVERLEKRLDVLLPKLHESLPRFEFKMPERMPIPPSGEWKGYQERLRKWIEQMPKPESRKPEKQED